MISLLLAIYLMLFINYSIAPMSTFQELLIKRTVTGRGINFFLEVELREKSQARGYQTFFMLNSTEHEIYPTH